MTAVRSPVWQAAEARRGDWRRWRATAAVVGLILLGGLVIALLQPRQVTTGLLDPASTGADGSHALAALLARRGEPVTRVRTAAGAARLASDPAAILVITDPGLLGPSQLAVLGRARSGLLLVAPGQAALARLAPEVRLAGATRVRSLRPGCGLAAARLAGSADTGGLLLRPAAAIATAPGTWACYPAGGPVAGGAAPGPPPAGGGAGGGWPSLLRYASGARTITVLGSGDLLSNADLGRDGNAALALNLVGSGSRVIWLVPLPGAAAAAPSGQRSLTSLLPPAVYAVTAELAIAVLLAALWRMRRFGPLVSEPLPVVVRASETVAGHGKLYRSRRARDRASAALREAALARLAARLGLPPGAPPDAVCHDLASRTGRDAGEVRALLFGPVPRDDGALVRLAADLDTLEGQVLAP